MPNGEREREMLKIDCEVPISEEPTPLWREVFWPAEWFRLRASKLYRGVGLPGGEREPVVLVPGFLSSDRSLDELHRWLERLGYTVHASGIARNNDCPDVMLARLLEAVGAVVEESGERVRLIGHSLGGTLARAASVRRPDLISQVICLGSPIGDSRVHPLVLKLARIVGNARPTPDRVPRAHEDHYHDGTCMCELADILQQPAPARVARASIFSKTDGVVDWRSSQEEPPGTNIEVKGTHLGLIVNVDAYRAIATLLAGASAGNEDATDA
jgi:pimeloyl-ACP methyl ester carboxylesterase